MAEDNIVEYGEDLQKLLISYMMSDSELFVRSNHILKPEYWSRRYRNSVQLLKEHYDSYKTMPTFEQVKAESGINYDTISVQETTEQSQWYFDTVEKFCKHKAMENLILNQGPDLIEKGQYGTVEEIVKENMLITLQTDLGTSYFTDPLSRLNRMKDRTGIHSTGWAGIDSVLYGGFERGTLNFFAGGPGTGKSLFMQNLCLNWVYQGFNVLYISLELSEELVGLRFDAMISNKSTKEILRNIDESALELSLMSKKHVGKGWGKLQIKKMPESSTTVNNIRAYIKEYEAQTKIKVDAIAVDYLDLLRPNNGKINLSDIFIKDKYVSEELRALAAELNIYSVSASQLGRAAAEEAQFSVAHIAGGISKINTADNVMAIYTNPAMKERGEYQIQFLKTRSSSGVGKFVMMKYDNMTMRITDLTEDNKSDYSNQQSEKVTSILNTVNRNNQSSNTDKQQNNKDRLAKLTGMTKR